MSLTRIRFQSCYYAKYTCTCTCISRRFLFNQTVRLELNLIRVYVTCHHQCTYMLSTIFHSLYPINVWYYSGIPFDRCYSRFWHSRTQSRVRLSSPKTMVKQSVVEQVSSKLFFRSCQCKMSVTYTCAYSCLLHSALCTRF